MASDLRRERAGPTSVIHGVTAGAVGTVVLNSVTYLDIAVRGRPSSSVPPKL